MSRNVTVLIYNPPTDGVYHRVAQLDDVEVEPGHEMDPGTSVLVPEPWASLIDWGSETWDEYCVMYELLVPLGATAENVEEAAPDVTVYSEDGSLFEVRLRGQVVGTVGSLAEAWYRGRDEAELDEHYAACAESEAAAEAAVERYYEERGYWASAEVEDWERRMTGYLEY